MHEKRHRSIAKAASWRIVGTIITMLLVLIMTGKWQLSVGIGFFELISKSLIYYIHERAWNRIHWGKEATKTEKDQEKK